VEQVDEVGAEVLIGLRAGTTMLKARITKAAARELDLQPGKPVVAVIKTSACHLLGA
jgi:molybdopterin-binding protein